MSLPFYDLIANVKDGDYVDAGWVGPSQREPAQQRIAELIQSTIPDFELLGPQAAVDKMVLWEFSKKVNGGNHFETFFQQTGSCVGNGGGQATWYLSAMEAVRLGKNIDSKLPFYLLPYGRSRFLAGFRGQGSGSYGAAFAQAISTEGILPFDVPDLPQPQRGNGITWGKSVEFTWSDGSRIAQKYLDKSRQFLVKSAAKLRSARDVWDAVTNGYPCTIASDWGGQMRPSAQGSPSVLLNRRVTTWQHQMCIIGAWNHPTLGKIFCVLNSWGPGAHGSPVDDSPPGSFWIGEEDVAYIVRQDDSFAFSQFDGFPSQRPDYWLI